VAPGEHAPAHAPAVHTLAQDAPLFCQVPVASHICGCSPLHWRELGVHDPEHVPALHT
jgi:hypothetical protein